MIGKLTGVVDSYGEDWVILDVNGVGYLVHCSAKTLEALPARGEAARLFIETQVRDDQIRLVGFMSEVEREWFRLLLTVQGVGSKVAARIAAELKDKAPGIAGIDMGVIRLQSELGDKVAPKPASDAVSALVNLGYGQMQASAAIAAAMREAGEGAETARLIRLGLRELSR